MMRRWEGERDVRFLTCSCYHRLPLLVNDEAIGALNVYARPHSSFDAADITRRLTPFPSMKA